MKRSYKSLIFRQLDSNEYDLHVIVNEWKFAWKINDFRLKREAVICYMEVSWKQEESRSNVCMLVTNLNSV